jgi:hypothetical protein
MRARDRPILRPIQGSSHKGLGHRTSNRLAGEGEGTNNRTIGLSLGPASPRMGQHQPHVDELARIERDRQQLTAVAGDWERDGNEARGLSTPRRPALYGHIWRPALAA